eukprot:GHVT01062413.1.p1 GENE.GHVT01062413.1~~GHVT01062413.1.p1  ORF type:complete len:1043 (+),score=118.48 GHVT01062413.1:149-3277(+)
MASHIVVPHLNKMFLLSAGVRCRLQAVLGMLLLVAFHCCCMRTASTATPLHARQPLTKTGHLTIQVLPHAEQAAFQLQYARRLAPETSLEEETKRFKEWIAEVNKVWKTKGTNMEATLTERGTNIHLTFSSPGSEPQLLILSRYETGQMMKYLHLENLDRSRIERAMKIISVLFFNRLPWYVRSVGEDVRFWVEASYKQHVPIDEAAFCSSNSYRRAFDSKETLKAALEDGNNNTIRPSCKDPGEAIKRTKNLPESSWQKADIHGDKGFLDVPTNMYWGVPKSTKPDLEEDQIKKELTDMRKAFFHLVEYWYKDKKDLETSLPLGNFFVTTSRDPEGKAVFSLGHSSWPKVVGSEDKTLNLLSLTAEDINDLKDGNIPQQLEYTKNLIQEFTEYPVSRNFQKKCFSVDFDGITQEISLGQQRTKTNVTDEFVPRDHLEKVLTALSKKHLWGNAIEYSFEPYLDSRVVATLPTKEKLYLNPKLFRDWQGFRMGDKEAIPILKAHVALEKVKAKNETLSACAITPFIAKCDKTHGDCLTPISSGYFERPNKPRASLIEIPANIVDKTLASDDVGELTKILESTLTSNPVTDKLKGELIGKHEYDVFSYPGCDLLWIKKPYQNRSTKEICETSLVFRKSQLETCLQNGLNVEKAVTELLAHYLENGRVVWIDLSNEGSFAVDSYKRGLIEGVIGVGSPPNKGMNVLVNHLKSMKEKGKLIPYDDPEYLSYTPGFNSVNTVALWQSLRGEDPYDFNKFSHGRSRHHKVLRTLKNDNHLCKVAKEMDSKTFRKHFLELIGLLHPTIPLEHFEASLQKHFPVKPEVPLDENENKAPEPTKNVENEPEKTVPVKPEVPLDEKENKEPEPTKNVEPEPEKTVPVKPEVPLDENENKAPEPTKNVENEPEKTVPVKPEVPLNKRIIEEPEPTKIVEPERTKEVETVPMKGAETEPENEEKTQPTKEVKIEPMKYLPKRKGYLGKKLTKNLRNEPTKNLWNEPTNAVIKSPDPPKAAKDEPKKDLAKGPKKAAIKQPAPLDVKKGITTCAFD